MRQAGLAGSILLLRQRAAVVHGAIVAEEPASSMFLGIITEQTPKKGEQFMPPNAVQHFVEALRSTGEGRASPTAPIAMRASR